MWLVPSWAIGVGIIILAGALGNALRAMLTQSRRESQSGVRESDIEPLRDALEDVQRRLGELEERLDFAERLLARQRDAARPGLPEA